MVQLQLTVREYQDLVPLEGVNVEVTPILVFRWRTGLELEKRPRRDASVGGEGGSSGRSIDAPAELVGETGFHEVTRGLASVNGVTDGSGRVAFGWDPAAPPISDLVTDVGTPLNGREPTKLMEFRIDTTLVALGGRRPLRSVPVHHRRLSRRVALDEGGRRRPGVDDRRGTSTARPPPVVRALAGGAGDGTARRRRRSGAGGAPPAPTDHAAGRLPDFDAPHGRGRCRGLHAGHVVHLRVEVTLPSGPVWTVARGSFTTADPAAPLHRIVFSSCQPRSRYDHRPALWQALDSWNSDEVLLIRDQVYGDCSPPPSTRAAGSLAEAIEVVRPTRPSASRRPGTPGRASSRSVESDNRVTVALPPP